jgi:hypothetical protein
MHGGPRFSIHHQAGGEDGQRTGAGDCLIIFPPRCRETAPAEPVLCIGVSVRSFAAAVAIVQAARELRLARLTPCRHRTIPARATSQDRARAVAHFSLGAHPLDVTAGSKNQVLHRDQAIHWIRPRTSSALAGSDRTGCLVWPDADASVAWFRMPGARRALFLGPVPSPPKSDFHRPDAPASP